MGQVVSCARDFNRNQGGGGFLHVLRLVAAACITGAWLGVPSPLYAQAHESPEAWLEADRPVIFYILPDRSRALTQVNATPARRVEVPATLRGENCTVRVVETNWLTVREGTWRGRLAQSHRIEIGSDVRVRGEIAAPLFLFVVAILALAFSTRRLGRLRSLLAEHLEARRRARADATTADHLQGAILTTRNTCQSFRLVRELGRGTMGIVHEAAAVADENVPKGPGRSTGEKWAVKVLLESDWQSEAFRERFMREAEICSHLSHPGIVKVLDWGVYSRASTRDTNETFPFIVMERVEGDDLRDRMRMCPDGRMPVGQAVYYAVETLRALKVAHGAGIVHRDLKPENIRITPSGRVKVMDFGIARHELRQHVTRTGTAMGTPRYMSPEHMNANTVLPASDIYSVGVMLFEMLTGQPPHDGDDVWCLFAQILTESPPRVTELRPDVPEALADEVARMLAKEAHDRPASASEAVEALCPWAEAEPRVTPRLEEADGRPPVRPDAEGTIRVG